MKILKLYLMPALITTLLLSVSGCSVQGPTIIYKATGTSTDVDIKLLGKLGDSRQIRINNKSTTLPWEYEQEFNDACNYDEEETVGLSVKKNTNDSTPVTMEIYIKNPAKGKEGLLKSLTFTDYNIETFLTTTIYVHYGDDCEF